MLCSLLSFFGAGVAVPGVSEGEGGASLGRTGADGVADPVLQCELLCSSSMRLRARTVAFSHLSAFLNHLWQSRRVPSQMKL